MVCLCILIYIIINLIVSIIYCNIVDSESFKEQHYELYEREGLSSKFIRVYVAILLAGAILTVVHYYTEIRPNAE